MIMDDRQFLSIGQMQNQIRTGSVTPGSSINKPSSTLPVGENSFANILKKAEESVDNNIGSESLKFSKHAVNRLSDRNIELTKEQMARLEHGKIEASEKGIKDSLIIIDQLAFIVNVPNNTVVTAMDQTENKSNVFTNIDGAVIA